MRDQAQDARIALHIVPCYRLPTSNSVGAIMAFYGVFIGVDSYRSSDINWLCCARRDAVALEALFADTLGGATTLLVDEDATRDRIHDAVAALTACGPEDTVVISFSGHGSGTHELVTHDADPGNLSASAIPLDELTDWFSRIPAARLVLILDCCFSGGMGARVLRVAAVPRSIDSVESSL